MDASPADQQINSGPPGLGSPQKSANTDAASPVTPGGAHSQFNLESLLHRLKNSFYAPDKLNIAIGSGSSNNLSTRLTKFMSDLEENIGRLIRKYNGDVLLFDTIFESGNLLRADRITP